MASLNIWSSQGNSNNVNAMMTGETRIPQIQLLQCLETSHASWHAPQHVVGHVQALQLTELAHAVRQAKQVVGAEIQLDQRLAGANVVWQRINAVVFQAQNLQ